MTKEKIHRYSTDLRWVGGARALPFRRHDRSYIVTAGAKPALEGSSDAGFRGDAARWNPEDLLVASLSACHHLWYMGLCAGAGIVVVEYEDHAEGQMAEQQGGGAGQFTRVTLRPRVLLASGSDRNLALSLHHTAHEHCFIARSVNFPVVHDPRVEVTDRSGHQSASA